MHIAFDISQTGSAKAGCGYFAHAAIGSMLELAPQHWFRLLPSFGDFYFDSGMPVHNPYPRENVQYGPRHVSYEAARAFWNGPGFESALGTPDVIHGNNFWCPRQPLSGRFIYTMYDLGFVEHPEWTTEANRVGCFEGAFRAAAMADWIVAISEASRNHYLSVFPHFPEARIRTIYPCSRFENATTGTRPKALNEISPGAYWLSVGTVEPRKNQRRLVRAYARYLESGGPAMPLVLAGGKGWLMEDFERELTDLGVAPHVLMAGYVSDEELAWLYRNCYANLYPSLFEGFGLPVLEGMQLGAPTLASRDNTILEVAGDAAILLPAEDEEAWAMAMLQLAADRVERNRLAAAGRARAGIFSWKNSASALLQLYEEALASPKRQSVA
jgi:glycosyltransferase involved in cell wall biosynthesis